MTSGGPRWTAGGCRSARSRTGPDRPEPATIRHDEEVGLALPTARSQGGFRLYTDDDVARLLVIKRMKPLDFTLEEMRDLLTILDRLQTDDTDEATRENLTKRLSVYRPGRGTLRKDSHPPIGRRAVLRRTLRKTPQAPPITGRRGVASLKA